jgi:hypothetical protein
MCMFCAAVPVAGAIGAKLNVEQKKKLATGEAKAEKPVAAITTGVIVLLMVGSVVYHTTVLR